MAKANKSAIWGAHNAERDALLRGYVERGLCVREIASEMGVQATSIYVHLRRLGIKAPTKRKTKYLVKGSRIRESMLPPKQRRGDRSNAICLIGFCRVCPSAEIEVVIPRAYGVQCNLAYISGYYCECQSCHTCFNVLEVIDAKEVERRWADGLADADKEDGEESA